MKTSTLVIVGLLSGTLAIVGCTDDEGGGGAAGTGGGGTGGSGGAAGTGGGGTGGSGGAAGTGGGGGEGGVGGVMPSTCDAATCRCDQANTPCVIGCAETDCSQECDGEGVVCVMNCPNGGCTQDCDNGAICRLTCDGSGCTQRCEPDAALCCLGEPGDECSGTGAGGSGGAAGSGGTAGTGGEGGTGGNGVFCIPGTLCCVALCAVEEDLSSLCKIDYLACKDSGGSDAGCRLFGENVCRIEPNP